MNPVTLELNAYFPREISIAHPHSEHRATGSSASQPRSDKVEFSSDDKSRSGRELTRQDKKEVEKLEKRDAEVREHEQQHKSAGGGVAGSIQLEYQVGPDGKQYAVGGEVSVDTSKEETPEATIQKAQQIKRAALAPADPSHQDRSVASDAQRLEVEARQELNEDQREDAGLSTPAIDEDGETDSSESDAAEVLGSPNDVPDIIRSERTPEATIEAAQEIRRAVLYNSEVNSSDRLAASTARRLEAEARQQIQQEQRSEISESLGVTHSGDDLSQETPHINLFA